MKKCTTYTIGSTKVIETPDYDADTSYLGEYGSKYKPGCIVRADRSFYEDHASDEDYEPPTMGRNECDFFYPFAGGEGPDCPEYQKYAMQDYDLMEDYNNSQWTFVTLTVKTHITTDTGLSDTILNSLSGIEDHCDKDSREYKKEIISDLLNDNKFELVKMGFSEDEINKSIDNPVYPRGR